MSLIQLVILAIVEGITEFLPISSTGHLILFSKFMNVPSTIFTKVFTVSIQFGAILSVVVLYGKRFFSTFRFYKKLLIAFIPAIVAGLLLGEIVDQLLENVWVVAISLIVGGIVLLFIDRIFKENQKTEPSYFNALIIGLFQCIALIPGISRSAATIVGGLTQKLSKKAAAEFSFFLAVPTMFAASCYIIYKNYHLIQSHDVYPLLLGNVISFIVALLAIRFFMQLVQRYSFAFFGYYRIIVGAVILVLLALGVKLEVV